MPEARDTDATAAARGPAHLRSYQRALPISLLRARESTIRKFRKHLDAHDMTLQQWRVIRALADTPGLDSKTLSERCVILTPSLTRIFKALTRRGLIRAIEVEDARRRCYELTPEGQRFYDAVSVRSEEIYEEIEAAFGRDNMAELLRLLDLLRATTDKLP